MKLNCSRVFFTASPTLDPLIVARYYDVIIKVLEPYMKSDISEFCKQIGEESFTQTILSTKDSITVDI